MCQQEKNGIVARGRFREEAQTPSLTIPWDQLVETDGALRCRATDLGPLRYVTNFEADLVDIRRALGVTARDR
jgi:hypothetical protein